MTGSRSVLSAPAGDALRCWPAQPLCSSSRGGDTLLEFDLDGDGRADYIQRVRGGFKDELHFLDPTGARPTDIVTRSTASPPEDPLLVLLLDGVTYERMHALYARGLFRLFRPPARLISVFPTLTDPAYDVLFGSGPTPGYEAGYYDRQRNRVQRALWSYVHGANERWVRSCDFRLGFFEDAIMYLFPRWVYGRELRRAAARLTACLQRGRRQVALYILSTDGLGHMLELDALEAHLAWLDRWLERAVYDNRGRLDVVMLADHGMSALPPSEGTIRSFDLPGALTGAGLRVRSRLTRSGDVVIPRFGLLDVARMHAFDRSTCERIINALATRDEVELLAARAADSVRVVTPTGTADIHHRIAAGGQETYTYQPRTGDPLELAGACDALARAGQLDGAGFASARAWLDATGEAAFPAAVPRLWDGFFQQSREQPDVILSLKPQWFVGSGLLSRFVRLHGTHGGLHRRVSETFVMTTRATPPSPLTLPEVRAWLRQEYGWPAASEA